MVQSTPPAGLRADVRDVRAEACVVVYVFGLAMTAVTDSRVRGAAPAG